MPPQKRNGIPDRWLDYQNVGKRIHGTRFIAFKVPLKQSFNRSLGPSELFGPWELQDALAKDNEELGLIIDLTFTTRYYNLDDIPDTLLYVKIFTAGHEVPSDDTILSFKQAVRSFLKDNKDNDKLIGVHCTHGLNRTGYLICRYLIDVDGIDPKRAIELFDSSRGHTIERLNYLQDLQFGPKRSNKGMKKFKEEMKRGRAVCRPSHDQFHSDYTEEQQPHNDGHYYRPFPQRGTTRGSYSWTPRGSHRPPNTRYQWIEPQPDAQWGQPAFHMHQTGHRYSQPEVAWSTSSHYTAKRGRGQKVPYDPHHYPPNEFWEWESPRCRSRPKTHSYRNKY